jgi:kynurenine formamidase
MISSFEKGDAWQVTEFKMKSHWFSHIDFPRHTGLAYPDSEQFPLEYYNGMASVLYIQKQKIAMHAITREDLEKAATGKTLHSILLIRTDWGLETSWKTKEFWDSAPYLTDDAIYWIKEQNPNAVAFDFPQDYTIRLLQLRAVTPEEQKTHTILLRDNILLIEYLTNFHAIGSDECEFICLPLNFKHIDGCPVRAVARI